MSRSVYLCAYFFSSIAAIIGILFFCATPLAAVSQKTANTLKVSPVRTDIEGMAGARKVVQATVTNLDTAPVTVRPVANDFVAGDEKGTPALILNDAQYAPTHSLKRFMSPLTPVTIPPKGSKTINVVITIPASAQAGGYFGSVRFMPVDPDGGGQVNLSPSVASLILLKVPGATVEDLKMTTFEVQKSGKAGFYFQNVDALQIFTRFENRGNVQIAPLGKIQLRQGDAIVYESDFNTVTPHDMILPDSARRWNVPLEGVGSIGYYTATATFTYGEKNNTLEVERSFLVAPLWVVVTAVSILLLGVSFIVFGAVFIFRRRRRHYGAHRIGLRRRKRSSRRRFGR